MNGKALLLALLLLPVLVMSPVLLVTITSTDVCAVTNPASMIDPSSVPNGPIAGYAHEQLVNAAHIMSAAADLGLTLRDQQIGVMTAMGESSLRVLDYGDGVGPDSRGLFQQRDNGAWGSYSDRMDPYISSLSFFRVLMTIEGREALEPTLVANAVQRNADPYHYSRFWEPAGQVVQALRNGTSGEATPDKASSGYELGTVLPQTALVANTVGSRFGIRTIGGFRDATSPYDDLRNGHSVGLALDFMIDDLEAGSDVGDQVAAHLQENADRVGVAYIIWRQRIWSPDRASEGWRPMADRGSATQNHMDHVHLSLTGLGAGAGDPCAFVLRDGAVSSGGWSSPANGPLTSVFGENRLNYGLHFGLDIGGHCESPIWAAGPGIVERAGPASGYGNWIVIDHGGEKRTIYGHMYSSGVLAHVGQAVHAGQQIGVIGSAGQSSGCHLHFQVEDGGNAIDPISFLAQRGVALPSGVTQ